MSAQPKPRMTVDEFLVWSEGRSGRHELFDGEVVAMSPQRARHAEVKFSIQAALRDGIRQAGLPCRMLPDGMTVRIDSATAYEPDALVYCGERLDDDAVEAPAPIIIVEVLSPSTGHADVGQKLEGYFRVPSVVHYLIVDPKKRMIVHHRRGEAGLIETRIVTAGSLALTPPGLALALGDVFAEA